MTFFRAFLFAALAASSGLAQTAKPGAGPSAGDGILIRDGSAVPQCPNQGPVILTPCAAGEDLILFDQPVYDDEGLFVICTTKEPYCIPDDLRPEGDAVPGGVDGVTMREVLRRFAGGERRLPAAITELAAVSGSDPLADSSITCNHETDICTCVSDRPNDCVVKLGALCDEADSFGSNGGVGQDCLTGNE